MCLHLLPHIPLLLLYYPIFRHRPCTRCISKLKAAAPLSLGFGCRLHKPPSSVRLFPPCCLICRTRRPQPATREGRSIRGGICAAIGTAWRVCAPGNALGSAGTSARLKQRSLWMTLPWLQLGLRRHCGGRMTGRCITCTTSESAVGTFKRSSSLITADNMQKALRGIECSHHRRGSLREAWNRQGHFL